MAFATVYQWLHSQVYAFALENDGFEGWDVLSITNELDVPFQLRAKAIEEAQDRRFAINLVCFEQIKHFASVAELPDCLAAQCLWESFQTRLNAALDTLTL